jgi:hypothetical protein
MSRSKGSTASGRPRRGRRRIVAAGVALVVTAIALLAASAAGAIGTPNIAANTYLFGPHQNASSLTFKHEGDCSNLEPGQVLWHFVLPQTTVENSGELEALFQNALQVGPVTMTKHVGGVIHWDVITSGDDVLLDAWTDAVSDAPSQPPDTNRRIRLSHVCGGGGETQFDATLATNVHDSAHNDITNLSVALGTAVHDLGTVTPVTGTIGSGTVHFSLYDGLDCGATGTIKDTADVALGTDNTGNEPGFTSLQATTIPRTLGAGDYSYVVSADLTSDTLQPLFVMADECEPFTVNKADLTIRTDIHNAAHQVITSADAGAVVHDTATLGSAVTGFTPDLTKVSFTFYANGTCYGTGSSVANTGSESTYVARSADSPPLAFGDYSYSASFAGDGNYNIAGPATCEPLHIFRGALTIGYWKTHMHLCAKKETQGTAGCSSNGPFTATYLGRSICDGCAIVGMLGNYDARTESKALGVFNANNCSNASTSDVNAAACLAAQLLGAQLNVANGANTCICNTIVAAKQFLIAVGYNGPGQSVTFSATNSRAKAIQLKTALDNYNNGLGCPSV